jgi:hypothetical protein
MSVVFFWYFGFNKTDCHNIAEILLRVTLNTITPNRSNINNCLLLFSPWSKRCWWLIINSLWFKWFPYHFCLSCWFSKSFNIDKRCRYCLSKIFFIFFSLKLIHSNMLKHNVSVLNTNKQLLILLRLGVMVFNVTLNNISAILWQSVLLKPKYRSTTNTAYSKETKRLSWISTRQPQT